MFKKIEFDKAVPIWAENRTHEMNCSLWFDTDIDYNDEVTLKIAGCNDYQVFVNGIFCFYGPARAARGYYCVDEVQIGKYLLLQKNKIEILVSAYNIDNFCFLNQDGFLCAEFVSGGQIFAETGGTAWRVRVQAEKIQKTQRYSFQRTFAEAYDFRREAVNEYLPIQICPKKNFIARDVPYPSFDREYISEVVHMGTVTQCVPKKLFQDRAIERAGNGVVGGFSVDELEICTVWEAQKLLFTSDRLMEQSESYDLLPDTYIKLSLLTELSGFIELDIVCQNDADIYITFDEILTDDSIDFTRLGCSNVLLYKLRKGQEYHIVSAQPYSLKYLDIACLNGKVELRNISIVRLDFDKKNICKNIKLTANEKIKAIYEAAVETFRQNTVDIYMDCPSRERAGWLCDSFFIARVEYLLTGKCVVERSFLANFLAEDNYYCEIPYGMLPMCYPADHADGVFIPNWAMWFGLQLKEYFSRTGDYDLILRFKEKMYRICSYFEKYENAEMLLEKLNGWIFVEWSRSNRLVKDINYPTNMLYYAFLCAVGELYGDNSLLKKAEKIKEAIRKNSRNGMFFCDNSVYNDSILELSGESTESCQYYAFFTGVAEPYVDKDLWDILVNDFGPKRKQTGAYTKIAPSNAFIGNYLRCDLLMRYGLKDQLEDDIVDYFYEMAKQTGTLWENDSTKASCNHGFASHVLIWLDYLGYLE